MAVDVHGHLDGAVADDLHDHARVDAEGEQQRHTGVAQSVQRYMADALVVTELSEHTAQVAGFERCSPVGAEDVAGRTPKLAGAGATSFLEPAVVVGERVEAAVR